MLTPASAIAIIGFGDMGRRVAVPFAQRGTAVRAWDHKLEADIGRARMRERIEAAGVDPAGSLAEALRGARLVVAAVDAEASRQLAQSVAPLLISGQVYLDLSGCAAQVHQDNALLVERCGAHHVAGLLDESLLLAGPRAASLAAALASLGCPARAVASTPCRMPDYHVAAEHGATLRNGAADHAPLRRGELP